MLCTRRSSLDDLRGDMIDLHTAKAYDGHFRLSNASWKGLVLVYCLSEARHMWTSRTNLGGQRKGAIPEEARSDYWGENRSASPFNLSEDLTYPACVIWDTSTQNAAYTHTWLSPGVCFNSSKIKKKHKTTNTLGNSQGSHHLNRLIVSSSTASHPDTKDQ